MVTAGGFNVRYSWRCLISLDLHFYLSSWCFNVRFFLTPDS